MIPVGRGNPVQVGACWNDPTRVQPGTGQVIVPLDLLEIRGLPKSLLLVQVTGIAPQVRVVHDPAQVRLEWVAYTASKRARVTQSRISDSVSASPNRYRRPANRSGSDGAAFPDGRIDLKDNVMRVCKSGLRVEAAEEMPLQEASDHFV